MSHSNDNVETSKSSVFENAELSSKFVVGKELGRGANSVVYEAEELLLQRKVALKVMKFQSDELAKERFLREARVCTSLKHPSIVQVYSYGAKGDEAFLAMELLPGKTLEQLIKEVKTLSKERFESVFMPVLSALELAHENNLLHRDIKPANIMIVEGPSKTGVKLLDFGLSKGVAGASSLSKTLTVADTGVGTPAYMSPEQCRGGKCEFSSDIYSLACVMYESLVGQPPFVGSSAVETMYFHMNQKAAFPARPATGAQIPVKLMEVILKGLEKDPSSRPASAAEFKQLLRNALDSGDNRILGRGQRKSPYIVAIGALLLLASFLLTVPYFSSKPGPSETLVRKAPLAVVRNWGSILKEAVVARSKGRYEEVLSLLKGAEAIYKKRGDKNALFACQSEILEAYLLYSESIKNSDGARAKAREALKYLNSILEQPQAIMKGSIPAQIARVYRDMGEPEKGVVLLNEILSSLKRRGVEQDVKFARVEEACAEACYSAGSYRDAESHARRALQIFDASLFGRTDPEGTKAAIVCAKALSKLNRKIDAQKEVEKTKTQLLNRTYKHDGITNALVNMAEFLESQGLGQEAKPLRAAFNTKTEAFNEDLKRSERLKDIFIPQ